MQDMMKKMKKKEGHMPEHEKNAKMSVLSHLRDMAQQAMGDKLHGVKKVSVMSDSSEGLKHGLEKAHEMVEGSPEEASDTPDGDETSPEHMDQSSHGEQKDPYENLESSEGGAEQDGEHHPMPEDSLHHSPEDVDAHIAHLQSLKKHMMKKKS